MHSLVLSDFDTNTKQGQQQMEKITHQKNSEWINTHKWCIIVDFNSIGLTNNMNIMKIVQWFMWIIWNGQQNSVCLCVCVYDCQMGKVAINEISALAL